MQKNDLFKGMSLLILAQILVGINIVSSKLLLYTMPVLLLLPIRFILATVILLALHWLSPARQFSIKHYCVKLKRTDWLYLLAQALSAGALFNCLMLAGLHHTDANVAGIITSALPAIIAIMSWLILGETFSAQKSFCLVFATAGLVVIAYDKLNTLSSSHSFLGDAIVLLSLLPEAAYYVLCKLHTNRLPVFLTSALLNGINALLLLPAMLWVPWHQLSISLSNWLILSTIGLSSGMFFVFWFMGAQRIDGMLASLSTAIMPVATVIIAWLTLGEQLTLLQLTGMTLVILSIVMYARR